MKQSLLTTIILVFFFTISSFSQSKGKGKSKEDQKLVSCQEMENTKAVELFEKASDKKKFKKDERIKFLDQALEMEPDYVDANFLYAEERIKTCMYDNKPFKPAEPYFKKVALTCPKYHSDPYYYLGFIYYEEENYDSAVVYLKKFINFTDDDDKKFSDRYDGFLYQAKEMMKYSKFYSEIFKKPVPFDPNPVNGVCTVRDEYLPIISPDNEMMMFTRRMPIVTKDKVWQSDREAELFSYSKRQKNGQFDQGQPMPKPFNKNDNEGGASLSIDNKHVYFTICKDEGGSQLNCDIYYSDYLGEGDWTDIKQVPGINDAVAWDSQPSIAADGKTLFFASDRKGGLGGCDIYKSVRDETGKWSPPVNIGNVINTQGNDKSPFMHSDSETLYFSSDGQMGVGGYDIFYSRKNEKGDWTEPKNIGYPINNTADDLGFFVSTDGNLGYFATNQRGKANNKGIGGWDIYSFELYKDARPDHVALITGKAMDQLGVPLERAKVEIKDVKTKKVIDLVTDSVHGDYAVVINLKKTKDIIITVKKENYAFSSQMVTLKDTAFKKPIKVDVETKPISVGQTYALNNIYYETNSADLKKESMIVVEEFIEFMKSNPTIKIEIQGHTDNVGDDKSNQALSADRAFTVLDALQKAGISKERLLGFKGFGKSQPIASNDTEEGRGKNRRTEFVIVEK
jgi:outer membrane protein OmpA-like peptidoglycan-associated protein/tetratricopeptide (TPR) repeat protein